MTNIFTNLLLQSSNDTESYIGIFVVAGILALVALYLAINYLVQSHTNKILLEKVLNNPESALRSATFVKSKYLYGIVNPLKGTAYQHGIPYHYIYVKYVDNNGFEKVVKIKHMISEHELRYIKCLDSIMIKTYKDLAVIVEDLSNPEITDEMLIKVQRRTGDTAHVKPTYYISTATGKFMIVFVSLMALGALGGGIANVMFAIKHPDNSFNYILIACCCFAMAGAGCFVLYLMLRDVIIDKYGAVHTGILQNVKWEYKEGNASVSEKVAYVLIDGKTERVILKSKEEYMFLSHYIGSNIGVRQMGRKISIDYKSLGGNPTDQNKI